MKKLIYLVLTLIICLSLVSCGRTDNSALDKDEEVQAFSDAIDSLLSALDSGNADEVYSLFSQGAKRNDKELYEDIEHLLSVYEGPTDETGWDGITGSDEEFDNGRRVSTVFKSFPVRCEDTYYWFYMDFIYENTFNTNDVGISCLEFFTAEEMYTFSSDGSSSYEVAPGLTVYADNTLREDIRCIDGSACLFNANGDKLDITEVKEFFEVSKDYSSFKDKFGEPDAEDVYSYYELTSENERPLYLRIDTENDGSVYGAHIVDDFTVIETVVE